MTQVTRPPVGRSTDLVEAISGARRGLSEPHRSPTSIVAAMLFRTRADAASGDAAVEAGSSIQRPTAAAIECQPSRPRLLSSGELTQLRLDPLVGPEPAPRNGTAPTGTAHLDPPSPASRPATVTVDGRPQRIEARALELGHDRPARRDRPGSGEAGLDPRLVPHSPRSAAQVGQRQVELRCAPLDTAGASRRRHGGSCSPRPRTACGRATPTGRRGTASAPHAHAPPSTETARSSVAEAKISNVSTMSSSFTGRIGPAPRLPWALSEPLAGGATPRRGRPPSGSRRAWRPRS